MDQGLAELARAVADLGSRGEVCGRLHRVLEPLLAYDARTGSDLTTTLKTYVESGGNLAATADRLFLHRNSVAYRLQRIQDLAGMDPRDRRTRLLLLVAFAVTDPTMVAAPVAEEAEDEDQRP